MAENGKSKKTTLERVAAERLAKLRENKKQDLTELPLLDLIPIISPRFESPVHLESIIPYLEAAFEGPIMATFSVPPRHGKSALMFHFIAKFLAKYPHLQVAYCSYSATFAERKSVEIRELCRRMGVQFDKTSNARAEWKTVQGGGLLARGPGGALTGEGLHLLVVDDPYRDRAEAESPTVRENILEWWTGVAMTRLEPGASAFVFHTRWSPDDLIAHLSEQGWPYINIPAIRYENDQKIPLWPSRYPLEALEARRKEIGEYDWHSMFQGEPQPRGGAVFNGTTTCTAEQFEKVVIKKVVIGLDMAYTAKTHSDYSVAVAVGYDADGTGYILDVRRKQCKADDFASELRQLRLEYPGAQIIWYVGGQEKVVAEFMRNTHKIPIKDIPAKEDKYARAQAVAAAWNAGRIIIPESSRNWREPFLSEVLSFTGLGGSAHDDQVDALAAAYFPVSGRKTYRGVRGPEDCPGGFNPFGF